MIHFEISSYSAAIRIPAPMKLSRAQETSCSNPTTEGQPPRSGPPCRRIGELRIPKGIMGGIIKPIVDPRWKTFWERIPLLGLLIFFLTMPLSGKEPPGNIFLLEVPDSIRAGGENPLLGGPELIGLGTLIQAGKWEKARSVAEQLAARSPRDPNPHYWLGYVLLRQHRGIAAIPLLRKAERLGLEQPDLPKTLGLAYYTLNQFVLFRRQMKKAMEADPKDPWPHFYLGLYELQMRENYKKAQIHFNQSLKLHPENARARYYHGYCHEILGQYDRAWDDYENALELLEPAQARFSLPYQRMAGLSVVMNLDKALPYAYALRAVEIDPDLAENHLVLAKIYESQGKLTAAVRELREAARVDPTLAPAHYRLFRLLLEQGDESAAGVELAEFQRLTKLYGP